MATKITIKKDSEAAEAIKISIAEKAVFRESVQNGKALEYIKARPGRFGQLV